MTSRLFIIYKKHVLPELKKRLKIDNDHAVPRLEKVVINAGVGKMVREGVAIEKVQKNLAKISGQQPIIRIARKSIASFKLRQGMPVGLKVTLRGDRMFHFVDKFINIVMPRIRDFRGISPDSIDAQGNLSIGVKEHTIFPEIGPEDIDAQHGLEITLQTTAASKEAGFELFSLLGVPFKKDE